MGEQNKLPFNFQLIKPEEHEELSKYSKVKYQIYRAGPKGYIVYHPYKEDAANIYNMPLRPTDIFVASYQRSGTTWTQELVWLLANDLDYTTAAAIPLTQRYPFLEFFMFFDLNNIDDVVKDILGSDSDTELEKIKSMYRIMGQPASRMLVTIPESTRRFIKTHLPLSLLNPALLDTSKMVYVARDPRDVAVSCYHHSKLFKRMCFSDFKEFWNIFYRGLYTLCPIFEHVKEAWEKRHHPNMLFLFYEDLSKDLSASIHSVADFLGKQLKQDQMERLIDHLSIENFRKNPSINFRNMRGLGMPAKDESFVRKGTNGGLIVQSDLFQTTFGWICTKEIGKTGGWRDYFDEEMTRQAEQWIEENLRDTDLRFPHLNN